MTNFIRVLKGKVAMRRLRLGLLFTIVLSVLVVVSPANAGPVVLGGDDLTDHGSVSGGVNLTGWLYIENAITNIMSNVTRLGNDGSIAALGAAASGATSGNAGAAIGSAGTVLSITVNYYEGAAAISTFFTDLAAGTVNPAVIWLAGTGAANDLDSAEGAELTTNASAIASFVASGGGLMAHGSGPIAYGWLSALLPSIVEDLTCINPVSLTAAGIAAFPGITNTDVNAGPCHSTFSGDLGGLVVMATDNGGLNVIIGGAAVNLIATPIPGAPDEGITSGSDLIAPGSATPGSPAP